ncbi:putative transcription factor aceii [Phaeomoniella chlamydospora]|uniref:Putative transcription factor aceii n=1 Tax=Phaeomoniella chlamydospora TaxID=158046 RepID=A0A0G2G242_PHACM|nr:putative transcription factor aceii [Phaeomoniella chlamydospora]
MAGQGPTPKRPACSRCRTQKLRCPRATAQENCSRCVKAGARCVSVTPKRPLRPSPGSALNPQSPFLCGSSDAIRGQPIGEPLELFHGLDGGPEHISGSVGRSLYRISPGLETNHPLFSMNLDHSQNDQGALENSFNEDFLFYGIQIPVGLEEVYEEENPIEARRGNESLSSLSLPQGLPANGLSAGVSYAKNEHRTQSQLTELSEKLTKHLSTIPSLSVHSLSRIPPVDWDETIGIGSQTMPFNGPETDYEKAAKSSKYSVEDSLKLNQALVDLYGSLQENLPQHSSLGKGDHDLSESIESSTVSCARESVDYAAILLALSCHHRIIEMWTKVISHIDVMAKKGILNNSEFGRKAPCSQVKIGSFVPQSTEMVATVMMALLGDCFGALFECIQGFTAALESSWPLLSCDGDRNPFTIAEGLDEATFRSTVSACEAVQARTMRLKDELTGVRSVLVDAEVMR